jgi:hypothetical protein
MKLTGEKAKYWGEKHVSVPLCPPQIPYGLSRDRTRVSIQGVTNIKCQGTGGTEMEGMKL